jgi:hypothetical protein
MLPITLPFVETSMSIQGTYDSQLRIDAASHPKAKDRAMSAVHEKMTAMPLKLQFMPSLQYQPQVWYYITRNLILIEYQTPGGI